MSWPKSIRKENSSLNGKSSNQTFITAHESAWAQVFVALACWTFSRGA